MKEEKKIQLVQMEGMNNLICDPETGLCMIPDMETQEVSQKDKNKKEGDSNEDKNLV